MDEEERRKVRRYRRRRLFAVCLLCLTIFCTGLGGVMPAGQAAAASAPVRQLVPVGHTVGIKLFSDGLMVVNLSESMDGSGEPSPARACGLRMGDVILEVNGQNLKSTEELQAALQKNGEEPVTLTVKRGAKRLSVTTTPQSDDGGVYRLGAWVRDSMAGIGTLTYYDPESKGFGALGHGITDVDTGALMPIASGSLMPSVVADVHPGKSGEPGELCGEFQTDVVLGTLCCNSVTGVFGTMEGAGIPARKAVDVAQRQEIRCGKATILANVNGDRVEEYDIKINRLLKNGEPGRDMVLTVTDPELLAKTGGIVQGMSGSPIIQNGKLVGAVTHVLVNSPEKGYGIFIENMLAAAE